MKKDYEDFKSRDQIKIEYVKTQKHAIKNDMILHKNIQGYCVGVFYLSMSVTF